jgi:hypothetical protein
MDVDAKNSMGAWTLRVKFGLSYHSELITTLAEINKTIDIGDPKASQILYDYLAVFCLADIQVSVVLLQKVIHAFVVYLHVLDRDKDFPLDHSSVMVVCGLVVFVSKMMAPDSLIW